MSRKPAVQAIVILLLALFPALITAFWGPNRPNWDRDQLAEGEIRLTDALKTPNAIWIDARTKAEYDQEHVPGAALLNEDQWNSLLLAFASQWQPDQVIIVYCDSLQCDSSHQVAKRLQKELGAEKEKVLVLKGGWRSWKQAQKP
ncbi:MAG TPA: rhodanese-like domain-containing protein [Chthoniobacterales bacterium]